MGHNPITRDTINPKLPVLLAAYQKTHNFSKNSPQPAIESNILNRRANRTKVPCLNYSRKLISYPP